MSRHLCWLIVALLNQSVAVVAGATEEVEEIEAIEEVDVTVVADASAKFEGKNKLRVERTVNMFTARTTRKHALILAIDHRAAESFISSDVATDYLGLDAGQLRIGLGLRFGILENLDVGLYRLNDQNPHGEGQGPGYLVGIPYDTYEFDARWSFLSQAKHHVDVALRVGLSWFAWPDKTDPLGVGAQLLVNRVFADFIMVNAGFLFHSKSSNFEKLDPVEDDYRDDVDSYSGAIGAGIALWFTPLMSWDIEAVYSIFGYGEKWPVLSTAFKFHTYRHTFSIMVSNTQNMDMAGQVTNARRGFDELLFGFQIVREFNF